MYRVRKENKLQVSTPSFVSLHQEFFPSLNTLLTEVNAGTYT